MTEKSAIGARLIESFVIVSSILLAFLIDAGWQSYQESRVREELIALLIDDFEVTETRLQTAVELAQDKFDRTTRFLQVISSGEEVDRDAFSELAYAFVTFDGFEPALSNYEAAVGSDGLASIHSPAFSGAVAKFFEWKNAFDMHMRVGVDMYYLGSSHDIRRELGSLGVLLRGETDCPGRSCIYPPSLDMSLPELRAYLLRPTIFSGLENARIMQDNLLSLLQEMEREVAKVLAVLRGM